MAEQHRRRCMIRPWFLCAMVAPFIVALLLLGLPILFLNPAQLEWHVAVYAIQGWLLIGALCYVSVITAFAFLMDLIIKFKHGSKACRPIGRRE